MAIDYDAALKLRKIGGPKVYNKVQTMLYALSIGMGRDPYDPLELPFVFEGAGLRAMPTMATVLTSGTLLSELKVDMTKLLHGEMRMAIHRPLPPEGSIESDIKIVDIIDKGADKGAIIYYENTLRETGNPDPLTTLGFTLFARGDGGFGGPSGPTLPVHPIPDRAPDHRHVSEIRMDQALLYRLNGDLNPLHADPALAERAGFKAPILHGLCGYGVACHAVLASVCNYDQSRISNFDVRFSSPVFPGDKIVTEIWVDGDIVSFRCLVEERGVTSINNGKCILRNA